MKLWENGEGREVSRKLEEFTAGEDILLDKILVKWDAVGSVAHATMLNRIGILSQSELMSLKKALIKVIELHEKGEFRIEVKDEDVHTAVENFLTRELGNVGKKIHTGRSRNDQVMVDIRLYVKEQLLKTQKNLLKLCREMVAFADKHKNTPMPGYTHFQKAMPSSVALWMMAHVEALLDDLRVIKTAYELNDQNPLGSAAGYGVPLDLDRDFTTKLLGFSNLQNNVLYVQNSRGKMESIVMSALCQVAIDITKMSNDIIIFSTEEFGFFGLSEDVRTGSSIMPKKRNPDILELVRGRSNSVIALTNQVMEIVKSVPSGYHRDLQETKGPIIKSLKTMNECIEIVRMAVAVLTVNREKLLAAFNQQVFATDEAYKLVSQGIPFRDAYKHVDYNFQAYREDAPEEAIKKRRYKGTMGNLGIPLVKKRIDREFSRVSEAESGFRKAIDSLLGTEHSPAQA